MEKSFLLSKFVEQKFPYEKFNEEIIQEHKELIFDDVVTRNSTEKENISCKSAIQDRSLLKCFIPEEKEKPIVSITTPTSKISPKNLTCWRKSSEYEKKSENWKITKEFEIKLSGSNNIKAISNSKETLTVSQVDKFSLQNENLSKLSQLLRKIKIAKKKNKKINIQNILLINKSLNIANDYQIWSINCKKGIGCNNDLYLGPFSSNQIIDHYENKNINECTEIRINLDQDENFNMNNDLLPLINKDFKLKEINKMFDIKENKVEKKKKTHPSLNPYGEFYDYYQQDSLYTQSNTPTNKKNVQKKANKNSNTVANQKYSDEYYYNISMNRKSSCKLFC